MKRSFNHLYIILGAVLLQLSLGSIYSWTLFNEAIHYKYGWEFSNIIITYSLTISVFAFTTMFSGRLLDKFGARKIATIGGILYGTGVMLTSRADTLLELYLYYGVIGGVGVGFAYVCPLATAIKWFPKRKGLVAGIVVGAFGLGSLLFKSIIESSLNEIGLSNTFFRLGFIYLILSVTGALLLSPPPKQKEELSNKTKNNKQHRVRDMVKTKNFYLIWITYFLGCISGLLVIGSATEIGLVMAKVSFSQAAEAVVVIALFNATGRLFWGAISDKIGCKLSLFIMFIITTIAMFLLTILNLNVLSLYLLLAFVAFGFGGFLVVYPTITSEYFGIENLGQNYGVIYQAYGIAALFGPIIFKIAGSYVTTFLISGSLSLLGALLIVFIKRDQLIVKN
ncbi:MAG: hypothetical protein B6229_02400 [Spirochaetaceae bacterium 4572_7]|nr:MAG: hypothetical protein B6229_02400 [Spirochaetaceae bacterium 4572_7]